MSVSVNYTSKATVVETIESGVTGLSDKAVTHSSYDTTETRTGASTPPATKVASGEKALSSGTGSLDLTALTSFAGSTVTLAGLKVQYLKLRCKSTNANAITIAEGASNGYDGFGTAFSITLAPGAEVLIKANDAGSDVSGTKKVLDLTGTEAQVLEYCVVAG
jgi:hypothetical protein